MMANYCTVKEVKSELSITDESYDDMLMSMIEQAKGFLDDYCGTKFDTVSEVRYFDGAGSILFIDDLVSVTSIKLDEDGDGTYEATMATTDYVLYPLNKTPKTYIKLTNDSDYGGFASGVRTGVKIDGTWGYQSTVPAVIRRASIIQVCRWFKRKDSAFQDVIGLPEMGQFAVYKGLDPDVRQVLEPYRKRAID